MKWTNVDADEFRTWLESKPGSEWLRTNPIAEFLEKKAGGPVEIVAGISYKLVESGLISRLPMWAIIFRGRLESIPEGYCRADKALEVLDQAEEMGRYQPPEP